MRAVPPVSRAQQAWNVIVGLSFFVAVAFVVLLVVIKAPWETLVPALFPGAVEKGLIAATISWGTTFQLAATLACLSGVLKFLRFPWQPEASTRVIDAKLNAIAKHLDIDLDAVIRAELLALRERGKKIEAIELYREYTGVGLAEAKAHVEALERAPEAKA